jgi:hypothetical protein
MTFFAVAEIMLKLVVLLQRKPELTQKTSGVGGSITLTSAAGCRD